MGFKKIAIAIKILITSQLIVGNNVLDSNKVNELNDLCFKNLYSDIDLAKEQAFEAWNISLKIDFKKGEANALNRIGVVYDVSGNFDSALYYYNLAYQLNKKIKNKKGEGSALCNIGLTYLNKGDYSNALNSFYAAIKPLDQINHYYYLGNCYNNIGLVFFDLKNPEKASQNYRLALMNYTLAGKDYEKASVLCNLAMILSDAHKIDSAILINLSAIKIFEKENDFYNLGKSYNNMASDYSILKDYKHAIACYLKAIEYQKKAENITGLGESLIYLAETYEDAGQKLLAEKYTNEAFLVSGQIRSPKVLSNIYYHYARVRMKAGDYKTASEYLVKVKVIRDSLFRNETSELIANTEAQYGIERKENENKQLMQQNKIQDLQIKNARIEIRTREQVTYLVMVFAFLLACAGFLYFRKRQKMQNLKARSLIQEAEHQQRVSISHDLHDNVGAQLSYIVSNLDIIQDEAPDNARLKSVAEMSKQAILTLRETVWALNNETVTIEVFADKFKQYVLKMLDFNQEIKCNFYEDIDHDIVLQPMQALNLFRICQEAFSNAIRHSGADIIEIRFFNTPKSVFGFKITDNGRGFDQEEGYGKGHFGLLNMKSRATEVGADYSLHTSKNNGTIIEIVL